MAESMLARRAVCWLERYPHAVTFRSERFTPVDAGPALTKLICSRFGTELQNFQVLSDLEVYHNSFKLGFQSEERTAT